MRLSKILVTGATGKTGGAVVAQLREKDFAVRAIAMIFLILVLRLQRLLY